MFCITCPILHKIVCIDLICTGFVLVLIEVELIHFVCSKCIRSIWTKTNINALHSNSIDSISRKNLTILHKSDAWYKLLYINYYLKRAPKKLRKSKRNRSLNNPSELPPKQSAGKKCGNSSRQFWAASKIILWKIMWIFFLPNLSRLQNNLPENNLEPVPAKSQI